MSFILAKQYTEWHQGFVIKRDTIPLKHLRAAFSFDRHKRRHPAKAMQEAFEDFARRNASPHKVPALSMGVPLTPVPGSDIDKIFEHHWWKDFYKKYPHTDGFLEVSLPGYSADHQTALVYISRSSGGLSGESDLILLEKKQGQWTLREIVAGSMA